MPIRLLVDPERGRDRRYKHTLRKAPYLVSLLFLLAATALTLLNIHIADMIHVTVRSPGPLEFETKYGLYGRCTKKTPVPNASFLAPSHPLRLDDPVPDQPSKWPDLPGNEQDGWLCEPFPTRSECEQFGQGFCVLWSTAGYASQLSLVPCLISLFSLMFIFLYRGTRSKRMRARRGQWKLVSGSMLLHSIFQIISFSIIIRVFLTDGRFANGARLDRSFIFGVISAGVSLFTACMLTFTGLAARQGKAWAAGKSAKQARRHRRTRSGRVEPVAEGVMIPPEQQVTIGEVEAAKVVVSPTERTGLLAGQEGVVAGGGETRATG